MTTQGCPDSVLPKRRILKIWWPLAASWLLMACEAPVASAVITRLPDPKISLAAFGGVVFPLAQFIAAPIIMLLAASTALSKDWDSYMKIRRFTHSAGLILTLLHVLIVFTPLYYIIVQKVLNVPTELIQPARIGLMIMVPWSWAIAYRRFNQGVLIRFGRSSAIGLGTLVRLVAAYLVLAIGYRYGSIPSVAVASIALIVGHVAEAIYIAIRTHPVLCNQLMLESSVEQILTFHTFSTFYIPLSLTQILFTLAGPITCAALSRMPHALESLALWPVVSGLVFLIRSAGVSYNEVVVALLEEKGSASSLHRFAIWLAVLTSSLLLLIVVTPFARFWFERLSGLTPLLAALARYSLWSAILIPGLSVQQSWLQGVLLHSHFTQAISESMIVFLVVDGIVLYVGILWAQITGLYIGLAAFSIGMLMQVLWLLWRSRTSREVLFHKSRPGGDDQTRGAS